MAENDIWFGGFGKNHVNAFVSLYGNKKLLKPDSLLALNMKIIYVCSPFTILLAILIKKGLEKNSWWQMNYLNSPFNSKVTFLLDNKQIRLNNLEREISEKPVSDPV